MQLQYFILIVLYWQIKIILHFEVNFFVFIFPSNLKSFSRSPKYLVNIFAFVFYFSLDIRVVMKVLYVVGWRRGVRMAALCLVVSRKYFSVCFGSGGRSFLVPHAVRFQLSYFCVNPGCRLWKSAHRYWWERTQVKWSVVGFLALVCLNEV